MEDLKKLRAYCVIQRELGRIQGIARGCNSNISDTLRYAVKIIERALIELIGGGEDAAD